MTQEKREKGEELQVKMHQLQEKDKIIDKKN